MMIDRYVFAAREAVAKCNAKGVITCKEMNDILGKESYGWDYSHGWKNLTYENTYVIPTKRSSCLCMPVPVILI